MTSEQIDPSYLSETTPQIPAQTRPAYAIKHVSEHKVTIDCPKNATDQSNVHWCTEQQTKYRKLRRNGSFFGEIDCITFHFNVYRIANLDLNLDQSMVCISAKSFVNSAETILEKCFRGKNATARIQGSLAEMYGNDSLFSWAKQSTESMIPIWLFPAVWSVCITSRVQFVHSVDDMFDYCFQLLQKLKEENHNVRALISYLNLTKEKISHLPLRHALSADISVKSEFATDEEPPRYRSLTLTCGEVNFEMRFFISTIFLSGNRNRTKDEIVATTCMNLLKHLEPYLKPCVGGVLREYTKKKIVDESNDRRNLVSAINKIGNILTGLLNDDILPDKQNELRNSVLSDAVLEENGCSETSSNSSEASEVNDEEFSTMNNCGQSSGYETTSDSYSKHDDYNEECKEHEKRGIKRIRSSVSDSESESYSERPHKRQCGMVTTTNIQHRINHNDMETTDVAFGPLTIDDVFPKAEIMWGRSPEKKQKVYRVVPIWIVPLIIQYLTLPELNNCIHPLWLIRKCDYLRSHFDSYKYNKEKTDMGFEFAEYCIDRHQRKLVSLREEITELKRILRRS